MTYQEAKSDIGKIFSINGDDHRSIADIFRMAAENSLAEEFNGEGISPEMEYIQGRSRAAGILAKLADSE